MFSGRALLKLIPINNCLRYEIRIGGILQRVQISCTLDGALTVVTLMVSYVLFFHGKPPIIL